MNSVLRKPLHFLHLQYWERCGYVTITSTRSGFVINWMERHKEGTRKEGVWKRRQEGTWKELI